MKKWIMFVIIASVMMSAGAESKYTHQISKPLQRQAAYGQVAYISVTPIPAQGQSYIQGMPFNIEESYVLFSTTADDGSEIIGSENGRLIANWSMISNSKVKLRISTTPMKHVSEESADELNYYLHFSYLMGYTNSNGENVDLDAQYFNVPTKSNESVSITEETQAVNGYTKTYIVDPLGSISDYNESAGDAYIGSLEGGIYFQFDEKSTKSIYKNKGESTQALPSGNYTARVLIEMVLQE